MSQNTSSPSLIDVLHRLSRQLTALYTLLLQEQTALSETDYLSIERLAGEKNALTRQVESTETQRLKVCTDLGIHADFDSIVHWLTRRHPDQVNSVRTLWESITQTGQRCATQNQINGLLVAHHQRQTREVLSILSGNLEHDAQYSNGGTHISSRHQHSLGKV